MATIRSGVRRHSETVSWGNEIDSNAIEKKFWLVAHAGIDWVPQWLARHDLLTFHCRCGESERHGVNGSVPKLSFYSDRSSARRNEMSKDNADRTPHLLYTTVLTKVPTSP